MHWPRWLLSYRALWLAFLRDTRSEGERIVEAAHDALLMHDAGALMALTSPTEVQALGLTETVLQKYLDEYILKDFGAMRVLDDDIPENRPDVANVATLVRSYASPDGRVARFAFFARERPEGVRLEYLVWSLFVGRMLEDMGSKSLSASQVVLHWADTIERDADELTAIGLKGVFLMTDGEEKFLTWEEFVRSRRAQVAGAQGQEPAEPIRD